LLTLDPAREKRTIDKPTFITDVAGLLESYLQLR
jgi:hypothetical protein